jgi:hypothetical protein
MGKLCIIMHHTTLCTTCITFILMSHICIFVIDHTEPGREEMSEPPPVEGVNPDQDQDKSRCI